jgi:hypothetical protein
LVQHVCRRWPEELLGGIRFRMIGILRFVPLLQIRGGGEGDRVRLVHSSSSLLVPYSAGALNPLVSTGGGACALRRELVRLCNSTMNSSRRSHKYRERERVRGTYQLSHEKPPSHPHTSFSSSARPRYASKSHLTDPQHPCSCRRWCIVRGGPELMPSRARECRLVLLGEDA